MHSSTSAQLLLKPMPSLRVLYAALGSLGLIFAVVALMSSRTNKALTGPQAWQHCLQCAEHEPYLALSSSDPPFIVRTLSPYVEIWSHRFMHRYAMVQFTSRCNRGVSKLSLCVPATECGSRTRTTR